MTLKLNYTITNFNALKPERDNNNCAGYNLFTPEDIIVPPSDIIKIDTGIIFEMYGSYYGQIENLSKNKKFKVLAGVIDPGYRGSIVVALFNLTNKKQHIFAKEKIAQILFIPILLPVLIYKNDDEEILTEDKKDKLKTYIKFSKTHVLAIEPTRFEEGSVGYDLHALNDMCVPPSETIKVDTGIKIDIEGSFYGQIRDKSGFSTKRKLHVYNGVVDSSYKNSIFVNFENLSNQQQHIFAGEKIAQIIFIKIVLPILTYKDEIDRNTIRGERGFQSGEITELC